MTEQFKAPEIIQLSSEQIANLSDAQFKTLVIRMLTELVEFGHKLDKKETYIQTSRRGGDRHQGAEDSCGCGGTETGGVWDERGRQSKH